MPLFPPASSGPVTQTALLASDHSISSATGTEVTGLQVTLTEAGTYRFEYYLIIQSSATGTGLGFSVNYTGTATRFVANLTYTSTGTTATTGIADGTGNVLTGTIGESKATRALATSTSSLGPFTGVATANADIMIRIFGILECSGAGDLELWHASESAVATTVESGSNVVVVQVL